jgi:hypothetical protein
MTSKESLGKFSVDKSLLKRYFEKINGFFEEIQSLATQTIKSPALQKVRAELMLLMETYQKIDSNIYNTFAEDYKRTLFNELHRQLSNNLVNAVIGMLFDNKMTEKPISGISLVNALEEEYWHQITPSVFQIAPFPLVLDKLSLFYHKVIGQRIDRELQKVTIPLDKTVKEEYKIAYYNQVQTFEQFLQQYTTQSAKSNRSRISNQEAVKVRESYERDLEVKRIEQMKKQQDQTFDNYQTYFKMDERELARAKRVGKDSRRSVSKISRRDKYQKQG